MRDHVKGFAEVQIDDTRCPSPVHRCHYSITEGHQIGQVQSALNKATPAILNHLFSSSCSSPLETPVHIPISSSFSMVSISYRCSAHQPSRAAALPHGRRGTRHSESIVMQSPCRVAEAPLPGHREHLVLSTGTARRWERLGEETEGRECPRCPPSPQRGQGLLRIHLQLCSLSGKKKPCSLPGTRPRLPFLLCRRMAVAGLKEPACACRRGG